jgi:hypothetical protein
MEMEIFNLLVILLYHLCYNMSKISSYFEEKEREREKVISFMDVFFSIIKKI